MEEKEEEKLAKERKLLDFNVPSTRKKTFCRKHLFLIVPCIFFYR